MCEKMKVVSEVYFALVLDRAFMVRVCHCLLDVYTTTFIAQGPVMVASPFGGVNIEEIARDSPSQIFKDPIDITSGMESVQHTNEPCLHSAVLFSPGIQREQAVNMANKLGFSGKCVDEAADQMMGLYQLLIEKDATTAEINPMVEVEENGQKRGKIILLQIGNYVFLYFYCYSNCLSLFSYSSRVHGCQD